MPLSEQEIVPYTATPLRGEKLLVLAPHPDDEVIGCGGLIALHAREKRQIRVLIASDGTAATDDQHSFDDYRARRERESVNGLAMLGGPTPRFLRLPDRGLSRHHAELKATLKAEMLDFSPDVIAVPSPIEVHPDHVALTRALIDLVQSDEDLIGELAVCRIAFYEVSQPIQPNTLVDITECADLKYKAIGSHGSQAEIRDYEWFARGLNQYRSMTLFPAARYAEAYHVTEMTRIRTEPWSRLTQEVGGIQQISVVSEPVPISVVIRTRNRQQWLQEALASVRRNEHPASVVIVNDGGASLRDVIDRNAATILEQSRAVGRSEAMNIGVQSATTPFVAFLDDDDLYYPEHLGTLAVAVKSSTQVAYYTDAISSFLEPAEDGSFRETARLRLFAQDFDRDLLLLDNYIPLPTLLVSRDHFLAAGGFDREFDLLEDWDFLIRLSSLGTFLRLPRVTCEIRHFRGSDSAILSAPEESAAFREAKLRLWSKHADRITPEVIANVFETQKRKLARLFGEAVDKKGLARHLERDVTRLDREKTLLLEELQKTNAERFELEARLQGQASAAAELQRLLDATRQEAEELARHVGALNEHLQRAETAAAARHEAIVEKDQLIGSLFAETRRLNDLLEMIYRSKTWKLHRLVERISGRR